jgi:hypothetical protein
VLKDNMTRKCILIAGVLAILYSTAVFADDSSNVSSTEKKGGVFAAVRTAFLLPFKGVVCLAGVISAPAAYVGSGLDSQVRDEAATIRNQYCSATYLLDSQWEE